MLLTGFPSLWLQGLEPLLLTGTLKYSLILSHTPILCSKSCSILRCLDAFPVQFFSPPLNSSDCPCFLWWNEKNTCLPDHILKIFNVFFNVLYAIQSNIPDM